MILVVVCEVAKSCPMSWGFYNFGMYRQMFRHGLTIATNGCIAFVSVERTKSPYRVMSCATWTSLWWVCSKTSTAQVQTRCSTSLLSCTTTSEPRKMKGFHPPSTGVTPSSFCVAPRKRCASLFPVECVKICHLKCVVAHSLRLRITSNRRRVPTLLCQQVIRVQYHPGANGATDGWQVEPTLKMEYIGRMGSEEGRQDGPGLSGRTADGVAQNDVTGVVDE